MPGTAVYKHRDRLGIKLLSHNWDKYTFMDPVCETKNFNRRDILSIFRTLRGAKLTFKRRSFYYYLTAVNRAAGPRQGPCISEKM